MSATGERRPRRSGEAGTTLIEALAVVSITALASLIAFPRLQQSFLTLSERHEVSRVEARLREARANALRRDEPVTFSFAADERTHGAADTAGQSGMSFAIDGDRPILFFGDGSSSGGVVRVFAGQRAVAAVTVAPAGGAMTVRPG